MAFLAALPALEAVGSVVGPALASKLAPVAASGVKKLFNHAWGKLSAPGKKGRAHEFISGIRGAGNLFNKVVPHIGSAVNTVADIGLPALAAAGAIDQSQASKLRSINDQISVATKQHDPLKSLLKGGLDIAKGVASDQLGRSNHPMAALGKSLLSSFF